MTADIALPFSLTLDSLAVWLDTLASLSPANAANQLNNTLRQLKNCDADAEELLPILLNLTPPCMYLSTSLSALTLAEGKHSLNAKSIKVAKLGLQLLRQLALAFCRLAESKELDTQQTQLSAYYALQLIGYCLRNHCLLYEIPSSSLWKKSATLYAIAIDTNGLEQNQAPKFQEFKAQTTIIGVLKRNLLFSILSPTRFSPPEINHFFQLANQYFELLDINVDPNRDYGFYWNLEGLEPCPTRRTSKTLPLGILTINCQRFANALQLGTIKTSLKSVTQAKLAMHLASYKQIFSAIVTGPASTSQVLLGFNFICDYLHAQDKLTKIMLLGGHSLTKKVHIDDMTLIPLEHEKNNFGSRHLPDKEPLPGLTVNMLRTNIKQFVIAEIRSIDCIPGDLALLYKEQIPPTLAIVRQSMLHDVTGNIHVLMELIPGRCSIYDFKIGADTNAYALIVGETGDTPEVFLPNGKYSVDSKIICNNRKPIHLNACLEYSTSFCRFKIDLDL